MSRNYPADRNPFAEDDETYGNKAVRGGGANYYGDYEDEEDEAVANLRQLQHRQKEVTKDSLAGTQRIMGMIHESETTGIATAEELARQGEQLDNAEANLDKMNTNMKETQRHINSLKSITGGLKNWFSDKKKKKKKSKEPEEKSSSAIPESIHRMRESERPRRQGDHPAFRTRAEEDMADDDAQIDRNLDEIADGTARLKELALGLGNMVEASNKQIGRVHEKSEQANITVAHQDKQMKKILNKKR